MARQTNPSVVTTYFPLPGRNGYSLSHKVSFDARPGEVYPVAHFDLNPFERLELVPAALIKTLPAISPIMSRNRCRLLAVWSPDKNYVSNYLTNKLDDNQPLPMFLMRSEDQGDGNIESWPAMCEVQPHSLMSHIGMPIGFNHNRRQKGKTLRPSALRGLMYYDFMRNYILNRNEAYCFIGGPDRIADSTPATANLVYDGFLVSRIDNYFEKRFWEYDAATDPYVDFTDFNYTNDEIDGRGEYNTYLHRPCFGGLMLKPHMPDINSAFASNSKYEEAIAKSIVRLTSMTAEEQGVKYQDIIDGSKVYNFYSEMLATGGQLDRMIYAEFGVNVVDDLNIPMFLRQWSFDLGFEDVVASTAAEDQPLGDLAGRGGGALSFAGDDKESRKRRRKNTLTFSTKLHGTLAIYFVIEPYVEYFQGFDPMLLKTHVLDKFWPSFDRAGWQPLMLSQLNATFHGSDGDNEFADSLSDESYRWTDSEDPFENQVGVQPAYTDYKGMVSRNLGNLATTLRHWTFSREYGSPTVADADLPDSPFNTYIMPDSYNYAFAGITDTYPYICSFGFDVKIKRPISRVQLSTVSL